MKTRFKGKMDSLESMLKDFECQQNEIGLFFAEHMKTSYLLLVGILFREICPDFHFLTFYSQEAQNYLNQMANLEPGFICSFQKDHEVSFPFLFRNQNSNPSKAWFDMSEEIVSLDSNSIFKNLLVSTQEYGKILNNIVSNVDVNLSEFVFFQVHFKSSLQTVVLAFVSTIRLFTNDDIVANFRTNKLDELVVLIALHQHSIDSANPKDVALYMAEVTSQLLKWKGIVLNRESDIKLHLRNVQITFGKSLFPVTDHPAEFLPLQDLQLTFGISNHMFTTDIVVTRQVAEQMNGDLKEFSLKQYQKCVKALNGQTSFSMPFAELKLLMVTRAVQLLDEILTPKINFEKDLNQKLVPSFTLTNGTKSFQIQNGDYFGFFN